MAKTKISEFDVDPANNTDINNINIAEGCAPSGINNAIRQLMSDLKEFQTGAGGDSITAVGVFSDTVGEKTSGAGVTVDGVLLKDNAVTASAGATLQGLTVGRGAGAVATNTAVGASALESNSTGSDITAVGRRAYRYGTAANNTALGSSALGNGVVTGAENTALGRASLFSHTTGNYNTAAGSLTLFANTTGSSNTAIGEEALQANTTASNNTAVGYQAGYSITTGTHNTVVGYQAGYNNTTGAYGTYLGNYAGRAITTGQWNIAIGDHAMGDGATNTANGNLCIGNYAGGSLTTGTKNTFIGGTDPGIQNGTGQLITTGSNNTILGGYNGNQGGLDIRTASNYIVLSDGDGNPRAYWNNIGTMLMNQDLGGVGDAMYLKDTGSAYGSGAVYIKFVNNAGSLAGSIQHTASTTTNYNTSSDQRLKTDKGVATDTSVIDNIVIHDFEWKEDGRLDRGVFAQEAYEVKPSAVAVGNDKVNENGALENPWGVDYSKFVPDLIVYCQQLRKEVDSLKQQLGK